MLQVQLLSRAEAAFFGLLTVALIVLKIMGYVEMGWIAILLLPIYGPICFILLFMVGAFIITFGALCIAALIDKIG